MRIGRVAQLMFFVVDPQVSAEWWADAFDLPMREERGLTSVELDSVILSFHPLDLARNPYGASTVPYLEVDDFDAVRSRMLERGSEEWRGPHLHTDGKRYLQIRDPRGLVLGISGL